MLASPPNILWRGGRVPVLPIDHTGELSMTLHGLDGRPFQTHRCTTPDTSPHRDAAVCGSSCSSHSSSPGNSTASWLHLLATSSAGSLRVCACGAVSVPSATTRQAWLLYRLGTCYLHAFHQWRLAFRQAPVGNTTASPISRWLCSGMLTLSNRLPPEQGFGKPPPRKQTQGSSKIGS